MTQVNPLGFVEANSKIEQTVHKRLSWTTTSSTSRNIEIENRESSTMGKQRKPFFDYMPLQFTMEESGV